MRAAPLLLALILAGCALDAPAPVAAQPAAFDRSESPWVAQVSSGCGMCSGQGGFRAYAEHFSFFVFANGRALLLEWNGGSQPGDVRVFENISYDRAQLQELVRSSPRGKGEAWVVRVTTANATDPDLPARLAREWGPGEDIECTDSGVTYLFRHANGTIEEQSFSCGPGGELAAFARDLEAVRENVTAVGRTQGIPR